jgi:hypothetical protein
MMHIPMSLLILENIMVKCYFNRLNDYGNATKKYSALDFVGIEATTPIDATAMTTHFHTDPLILPFSKQN